MPTPAFDNPSYFALRPRQSHRSTSYERVSPLGEPVSPPTCSTSKSVRPHKNGELRSQSENTFVKPRYRVETIVEGVTSHHASPSDDVMLVGDSLPIADDEAEHEKSRGRSPVSERTSTSNILHTSRTLQARASSSEAATVTIPSRKSYTPSWTKVFVRRSWDGGSIKREVSHTSNNACEPSSSAQLPRSSLLPLRPPSTGTRYSAPVTHHRIKVEKSFTNLNQHIPQIIQDTQRSQRPGLVTPKEFLTIPFATLRKLANLSKPSTNPTTEAITEKTHPTSINALDHETNLRKQQTANVLNRVTSALQEFRLLEVMGRNSTGKAPLKKLKRTSPGLKATNLTLASQLSRAKSMEMVLEDTVSCTSSLAKLRMGPTPYNTPEEEAKYTVCNQAGQYEEFFKIDISIRGGTSYLPSEARRIHTPPLPSDGLDGKRRGYFFDYSSPLHDLQEKLENSALTSLNGQKQSNHRSQTIPKPLSLKRICPKLGKKGARVKTGDWYATKLAEFDSSPEGSKDELLLHTHRGEKQAACYFDVRQEQVELERQLDYDIPEHLPTSPLCPRHPRYWRVVKSKGNQFRGCWMHGFGEFNEEEKAKYGIVEAARL